MKLLRLGLVLTLTAGLSGVAYVAQQLEPAGTKMATAAEKFLSALKEEQKAKANLDFDSKERTNFHFVPLQDNQTKQYTRKGLPLEEMTGAQKAAAMELVRAGTSDSGYLKATTIMSLESILRELEKGGAMVRNPEWYFFTVFGKPGKSGKWGWRVEGHHLSLNFTLEDGKVVSASPAVFGANPARIKDGPKKGLRTLPEADDLARELFNSLDDEQKKVAHRDKQFREIEQANIAPTLDGAPGLSASKLNQEQRQVLKALVTSYADRMPEEVRQGYIADAKAVDIEKVYFGYAGTTKEGEPHSYRVTAPAFVIEFLNVQADSAKNPANHIHSAWRNPRGDFGLTK